MEALACFVAVAEELHFARAAERLHRSPSAVSRAVRDLERSLGTELFVRSPRSVRLTAAGQAVLDPARQAVASLSVLRDVAQTAAAASPTVLRFGLARFTGDAVAEVVLDELAAGLPDLSVSTSLGSTPELVAELRRGELDVIAAHLPVDEDGLVAFPLLTYRLMVAMRSDDPLSGRPSLSLADLAGRTVAFPTPRLPANPGPMSRETFQSYEVSIRPLPSADLLQLPLVIRHERALALVWALDYGGITLLLNTPDYRLVPFHDDRPTLSFGFVARAHDCPIDVPASLCIRIRERLAAL